MREAIHAKAGVDLGQSGSSAVDRAGSQKLAAEVGLGHAGLVLGLEVSRLARNSTDWHRLLQLCACSDMLILDEDGIWAAVSSNYCYLVTFLCGGLGRRRRRHLGP